jgi:hypothetical protein
MEKAQELHNNIENLKKQMAWAIVVEEEEVSNYIFAYNFFETYTFCLESENGTG